MGINVDPDFLIVQKMRMGDEKAFEDFIARYYPIILKYCRIHIRDQGYAEDMTQETFMRFFQTFNRYQHYGKAANYLYVIAGNICKDFYRKQKEIPFEELSESMGQAVGDPEEKMIVEDALKELPEELKEAAVLFFWQGRRQKDIAQILGISLSLVKYRIRRAKKLLTVYFEKEGL